MINKIKREKRIGIGNTEQIESETEKEAITEIEEEDLFIQHLSAIAAASDHLLRRVVLRRKTHINPKTTKQNLEFQPNHFSDFFENNELSQMVFGFGRGC
jgi:hypothetical protein